MRKPGPKSNKKFSMLLPLVCALFVAGLLYMFSATNPDAALTAMEASPLSGKCIVIDAGHGGADGGATGVNRTIESDLNLDMAFTLKNYLEACGIKVIMTRTDKGGLGTNANGGFSKNEDMRARKKTIVESNADLVISLHMNKYQSTQVKGAQVFFQKGSPKSEELAQYMQELIREKLQPDNRRTHQSEDFYVLRVGEMPGVLIECGFISNPEEAALLSDETYREKLSFCITRAITRYFTPLQPGAEN